MYVQLAIFKPILSLHYFGLRNTLSDFRCLET